jgi:hypothetical protein
MNPLNLFISSFDNAGPPRIGSVVRLAAWVIIGLAVIDALINAAFPYPSDPKNIHPSALQSFFDYGRSTEGKLARMTRLDKSQTAPITLAGWYDPLKVVEETGKPNSQFITFYGMSHAVRLAEALGRVSDRYIPRIVAAPGAPGNWAYGAYLRDHGGGKSRVAVLALWSQNLPMITAMAPMTWASDLPTPYTADRFFLENNQLEVIYPPYASFDQYAQTFTDPRKWATALKIIADNDPMYSSFIMRANILDHSALFRLIRRSYAQRARRHARQTVLDSSGYHPNSEAIKIAQKIVQEFAERARRDGMIPVIYLINAFGDSDYLFQAVRPALLRNKIPYLSSHTIASPSDPRKYLPDSHFTAATDDDMARALVKLVDNISSH